MQIQRGTFRVGKKRPESPRVQNALWESMAKGGEGVWRAACPPTPGHVQVLSMAQGQGSVLGAPHSKGAQPQLGHLKAKAKGRISLLVPRSVSVRKSGSYLQLLDLGGGPDLSLLGL